MPSVSKRQGGTPTGLPVATLTESLQVGACAALLRSIRYAGVAFQTSPNLADGRKDRLCGDAGGSASPDRRGCRSVEPIQPPRRRRLHPGRLTPGSCQDRRSEASGRQLDNLLGACCAVGSFTYTVDNRLLTVEIFPARPHLSIESFIFPKKAARDNSSPCYRKRPLLIEGCGGFQSPRKNRSRERLQWIRNLVSTSRFWDPFRNTNFRF